MMISAYVIIQVIFVRKYDEAFETKPMFAIAMIDKICTTCKEAATIPVFVAPEVISALLVVPSKSFPVCVIKITVIADPVRSGISDVLVESIIISETSVASVTPRHYEDSK